MKLSMCGFSYKKKIVWFLISRLLTMALSVMVSYQINEPTQILFIDDRTIDTHPKSLSND